MFGEQSFTVRFIGLSTNSQTTFRIGVNTCVSAHGSRRNLLKQGKAGKVIVERFRTGDDVLERLNVLVRETGITAGSFTALGALEKASVGFFSGDGRYSGVSSRGPMEVASCVGNVSLKDGKPYVHAHIVIADKEGNAYGGHLMEGCVVSATFEVTMLTYEGINLSRKLDSRTGLYLLDT